MRIILVTFANKKFRNSRKKLINEAKKLNIFDKFYSYCEHDLPDFILKSAILSFDKGYGFWTWKPYLIKKALQDSAIGDIIVYMDAGFTLNSNSRYKLLQYINLLNNHQNLFFKYSNEIDYGWSNFGENNTLIKNWIKSEIILELSALLKTDNWLFKEKIMAGFFLIKNTEYQNNIISTWFNFSIFKPEFFFDELALNRTKSYNAHRHDQSILSAIIHSLLDNQTLILDEEFEIITNRDVSSISATRRKDAKNIFLGRFRIFLYNLLK